MSEEYVVSFDELGAGDVPRVGGKNASLGELIRALAPAGISVPAGFATTATAYRRFVDANRLDGRIRAELAALAEGAPLGEVGASIRDLFERARWPEDVARAIVDEYRALGSREGRRDVDVAVRSSATAEDLPEASFAGQLETFLNVRGEDALLDAARRCLASLFTDRAIAYREEKGFDHASVALSVGVQKMVRSDLACAGVMFTIDTESGFPDVVVIDAAWGLGESVVSGAVDPDRFTVFKPLLDRAELAPILEKTLGGKAHKLVYARKRTRRVKTSREERARFALGDEEILRLARWGAAIEAHYSKPMDVEWAKDGESGRTFIVQARAETVHSRRAKGGLRRFELRERGGDVLVKGLAIGDAIGAGKAFVLRSAREGDRFEDGGVLVAETTDPDWVPIMRRASAIVTEHGGRTSHAAIVSRELGVPAVIGTGSATSALEDGSEITVSCAEGEEGRVYRGILEYESREIDLGAIPKTRTKVMINVASPEGAFRHWALPAKGVGLARLEFLIGGVIRAHPMALIHPERVARADRRALERCIEGYADGPSYFVDVLARGIAKIAASRYPDPVIVRFSDFKTNEYAALVGGGAFEPHEENPMLGFRGASRYYDDRYREAFALECRALRRAREIVGVRNVIAMIPFCRTPEEADRVIEIMRAEGLARGGDFQLFVMAEIPSNVILAKQFSARVDGFSIGSNDLTQLVLGVDRDSALIAHLFDESNDAVKWAIRRLIADAHACGRTVGFCGQAPSDDPSFAAFLVDAGIDSISVDASSFLDVVEVIARAESAAGRSAERGGDGRERRPSLR